MKFNELTIILTNNDKLIKIVYEGDTRITYTDDLTIEFVKKLRGIELEKFLKDVFGTTKIGVFDCRNASDKEIERIMNYEAMWNKLKAKIESDLAYHQSGSMQSIGESIHGAAKCEEVLRYMKEIEEQHTDLSSHWE